MTGNGKITKDFFQRVVWKKRNSRSVFSCIERRNCRLEKHSGKKKEGKTMGRELDCFKEKTYNKNKKIPFVV